MAKIRKAYQRERVGLDCGPEVITEQHHKQECDVNYILRKYQKTGLIDHVNRFGGDYSDLSDSVSFHEAMNICIDAENAFNTLPSSIRKKFDNDPGSFLDFVSDESNLDEMVELGLVPKIAEPVVPAPPAAPAPQPEPAPPAEA
jgi:phage internal scaffolding protein